MKRTTKGELFAWVCVLALVGFIFYTSSPRGEWEPNYATNELTWTKRHWFKKDEAVTVRWLDESNAWCATNQLGNWEVVIVEPEIGL